MQKNYVSPDYMKDSFTCPHCGTLSLMNYVKVNYFRGKYQNTTDKYNGTGTNWIFIATCQNCKKQIVWIDKIYVYPDIIAIGKNLTCIFVDHGMLRKNEFKNVLHDYECLGLNVIGVDASEKFFSELAGVTEPERKRKIIGKGFIDVFDEEAHKIQDVIWLAQGTIYPDCIESLSITGTVIKSHHNVGGLPEKMNLKLCEPLRLLFKDEVRRVGRELGMPEHLITRHPFPGPGLAVRILGDITREKVRILQDADDIFIQGLRDWKVKDENGNETSLYHQVWQAGVILLPVQSVGVMGDERTYERAVALRAVTSTDAMTADWAHLPYEFMAKVSNDIINKVKGVNRVCYDISSKPPATIEWE